VKRPTQQIVEVGDRIRFDGRAHTLAGLDGPRCRLVADDGTAVQVVLLTQMCAGEDFAVLDRPGSPLRVPAGAPLDGLDAAVRGRALDWQRHILEVETGRPDPLESGPPRPAYDPAACTLAEREEAKAAELTARGQPVSVDRRHREEPEHQREHAQQAHRVIDSRVPDEQTGDGNQRGTDQHRGDVAEPLGQAPLADGCGAR
jgi:hypothetical protein